MTNARMKAVARTLLFGSAIFLPMIAGAQPATAAAQGEAAASVNLNIPAQDLGSALSEFARQSNQQLLYSPALVRGKRSTAVSGRFTPHEGLRRLLSGTNIRVTTASSGAFLLNGGAPRGNAGDSVAVAGIGVVGNVVDRTTGANLKGALVEILETGQRTSTDDLGTFRFSSLPPGTYTVRISYLGYQDIVAEVEPGRGDAIRRFAMVGGTAGQEVVVYGYRSTRAQALNQERSAENSSTVISSDQLGNFSGTTISEALKRAPGVAFQRSERTGDGTNIIVRGLEPNLNTVKLNGVELPVGDGISRSADLSNFLADSVEKVTINKTLLPSQDSAGIGGLVEIETKSPLDRPRRYARLSAEYGRKGGGFGDEVSLSGTVSAKLTPNFGLSASVQYRDREVSSIRLNNNLSFGLYLPRDSAGGLSIFSPFQIAPGNPFPFENLPRASEVYPNSIGANQSLTDIQDLAITFGAQWLIGQHSDLRFDYQRSTNKQTSVTSDQFFLPFSSYATAPVSALDGEERNILSFSGAGLAFHSYNFIDDQKLTTSTYSFRGSTTLDRLELRYAAGYADGSRKIPLLGSLFSSYFEGALGGALVESAAVDAGEGRIFTLFPKASPDQWQVLLPLLTQEGFDRFNDPAAYSFGGSTLTREGRNRRYTASASSRYNFAGSPLQYVELGMDFERSRFRDINNTTFSISPGTAASLADLALNFSQSSFSTVGLRPGFLIAGDRSVTDFFRNHAALGEDGIVSLTQIGLDPLFFQPDTTETEFASYAQARVDIGKVEIIGGARLSKVKVRARQVIAPSFRDENGVEDLEFAAANTRLFDETARQSILLPRLLINYRPSDSAVVRLGYFKSIARPRIRDLSQSQSVFLSLQPIFGPNSNQAVLAITKGNPDLKPAVTDNLDLSLEHYDRRLGAIKFGLFYKRISNLLEQNSVQGTSALDEVTELPEFPNGYDVFAAARDGSLFVAVDRPVNNSGKAKIWGAEASIEKQLTFLPGALAGLGFALNYTYTDSSKVQPFTFFDPITFSSEIINIRKVRFNEQPKHSGTVALTYSKYGLDGILSYTRQSRRQLDFQLNGLTAFHERVDSLDFKLSYDFKLKGSRFNAFVQGNDLLRSANDPQFGTGVGGEDGTPRYIRVLNFLGGREIRLGISATF